MNWGWVKAIGGFFTGGSKTSEKVIEMADDAVFTKEEAAVQDAKDTDSARAFTTPSHESWFDVLVDGANRLVRPFFAFWSFGVLVGFWGEKIKDISPEAMQLILIIITFYFGGRAILKDLPSMIKSLRTK